MDEESNDNLLFAMLERHECKLLPCLFLPWKKKEEKKKDQKKKKKKNKKKKNKAPMISISR